MRSGFLKRFGWVLLLGGVLLGQFACAPARRVAEDDALYIKGKVAVVAKDSLSDESEVETVLKDLLQPDPNSKFLGMRLRLQIHNLMGTPRKKKSFRRWVQRTFGEAPVTLSQHNPERTRELMLNRLVNRGHFGSEVEYKLVRKGKRKRKVKVYYTASVPPAYRIRKFEYPPETGQLERLLALQKEKSLIKAGDQYQLSILKDERARLDEILRERGYYFFTEDMMVFKIDSSVGNRQMDIYLRLKDDIPTAAKKAFSIRKVSIYPHYQGAKGEGGIVGDSSRLGRYWFFDSRNKFRHSIIARALFLKPGGLYSVSGNRRSLKHLSELGVFKFANIRYSLAEGDSLDANVLLTPFARNTVGLEFNTVTKSNGFAGPGLELSYINRNLFRGAEQFKISIDGYFEWQIRDRAAQDLSPTAYEVDFETGIDFPRVVGPFPSPQFNQDFVPHTFLELSFRPQRRPRFYTLLSFDFTYGYSWKRRAHTQHTLEPVNLTYLRLGKITDRFEDILSQNPLLIRSFAPQFIAGGSYRFSYISPGSEERRNRIYFSTGLSTSGNVVALLNRIGQQDSVSDLRLFGIPVAQYGRLELDFRYYLRLNRRNQFAFRLFSGTGLPYGSSVVLPYAEQFYSGGVNGIRAFQARSLGPGGFKPPPQEGVFLDQTGDVKLESNFEYRFELFRWLEGALFFDVGNVWLTRPDSRRPDGNFKFDTFYRQLAVGTGLGGRVKVSVLVIRLDFGLTLRDPNAPTGLEWVINNKLEKIVTNLAIGYPF